MRTLLISDTHFNHDKIKTYCDRPTNFTDLLIRNWRERVQEDNLVIHLGDVGIGRKTHIADIIKSLPGRKVLIRGNHDREKSNQWWMEEGGFDFACDATMYRNWWLTHEPAKSLPWEEGKNCLGNIHGHLHNVFHGFNDKGESFTKLYNPWQRVFAVEYTNFCPIEFDSFVNQPDKYLARGTEHLNGFDLAAAAYNERRPKSIGRKKMANSNLDGYELISYWEEFLRMISPVGPSQEMRRKEVVVNGRLYRPAQEGEEKDGRL